MNALAFVSALRRRERLEAGSPDALTFVCQAHRWRITLARVEHRRPYLTREEAAILGVAS
jgi:hypothetical protein